MEQDTVRTHDQNAKFHAMVRDIAKQLTWAGQRWGEEDWKRILLAAKFDQKVVPSPFGHGFIVVNNKRSRDLSLEQMTELIGEVEAFGAERGVDWSEDESC
jgi:hypothetical protein